MAHQVVRSLPLRFIAKGVRLIAFLKDSTIQTSGLHLSRPNPRCKGAPEFFALCRSNHNAQALDDQVAYLATARLVEAERQTRDSLQNRVRSKRTSEHEN